MASHALVLQNGATIVIQNLESRTQTAGAGFSARVRQQGSTYPASPGTRCNEQLGNERSMLRLGPEAWAAHQDSDHLQAAREPHDPQDSLRTPQPKPSAHRLELANWLDLPASASGGNPRRERPRAPQRIY